MFDTQFWVIVIGAVAAIAIGYGSAMAQKANAKAARPAGKLISLESPLAPDAVFARLRSASLGRFALGDSDAASRVLVFASAVTPFSWGFFLPVFIRAASAGSRIDVGIRSRLKQWGPVVTNTHKEFVAALERALGDTH